MADASERVEDDRLRQVVRGCLVGAAVGDALGAPVEFMPRSETLRKFGREGITLLHPWEGHAAGSYTDDTQMTMATARGLLDALRAAAGGEPYAPERHVLRRYLEWQMTQHDPQQRRHPGITCLRALDEARGGRLGVARNHSKGCGGVMRMAPVGLVPPLVPPFALGCRLAALTHGHPLGYLPAGFVADLCARLRDGAELHAAIRAGIDGLKRGDDRVLGGLGAVLRGESLQRVGAVSGRDEAAGKGASSASGESVKLEPWRRELAGLLERALKTAERAVTGAEGIAMLGQGWVGEEALAIALFSVWRHPDDWHAAVVAAVNHDGDSDSTGCIAGAVLGACLGLRAIPELWVAAVENRDPILTLADELVGLWSTSWGPACG